MNLDGYDPERLEAQLLDPGRARAALGMAERWILSRLQAVVGDVDAALESFRFSDAANAIFHFVDAELLRLVHRACQAAPPQGDELRPWLSRARNARRHVMQGVLATALEITMRLAPPVLAVRHRGDLAAAAQAAAAAGLTDDHGVPAARSPPWIDPVAEAEMQLVQNIAVL